MKPRLPKTPLQLSRPDLFRHPDPPAPLPPSRRPRLAAEPMDEDDAARRWLAHIAAGRITVHQ